MSTDKIGSDQWQRLYGFLQRHEEKCRRFVEAFHRTLRTGTQWRELPDAFGKWTSVFKRYARGEEKSVWADMFKQVAQDPDMAVAMPDSTAVRAYICAAGGTKEGGASEKST